MPGGVTEEERRKWLGYTGKSHADVFCTRRDDVTFGKPGQLTEDQLAQYYEKGYVVLENYFTDEELGAVKDDIEQLVEKLSQELYDAGKITDQHRDKGFYERLVYLQRDYPGANVLLHKRGQMLQGTRDLWSNERILNAVEQLIGPDIAGHPVWNLRTKTPHDEATTVPWHQDSAYLDNESYEVLVPTAWIPLLDTNKENGCMQMVSSAHRLGTVALHQCCSGSTHYIILEEEEMKDKLEVDFDKDIETCPVPYGGLVLFHNLTPHRSLNNLSTVTRWSLDLRWQSPFLPYGFNGIKEGIVFRKKGDPDFKPAWDEWLSQPPREILFRKKKDITLDPFDATITGHWMEKWQIVNMNHHTEAQKTQSEG